MNLKPSTRPFAWNVIASSSIDLANLKDRLDECRTEVVVKLLEERSSLEDWDLEPSGWVERTPKWVRKELEVVVEACAEIRW